jgi:hypothetical protein
LWLAVVRAVPEFLRRVLADRYELGRVLGAGGMATVYLASDWVLQRQVAVKVLNSSYVQDPSSVERFRAEARIAAKLSHPNIVAVFDAEAHRTPLRLVAVAGIVVALMVAMLWPDGRAPAESAQANPTIPATFTSLPSTTVAPPTTTTRAPSQADGVQRAEKAEQPNEEESEDGGGHGRAGGDGKQRDQGGSEAPGRGRR